MGDTESDEMSQKVDVICSVPAGDGEMRSESAVCLLALIVACR